ncbi:MAG TPA: glycosyltransferase family 1 protein [Bryobacteraceae bacterium]|nr:glycosyltransferase family 1 protein [Bryobacteraceae bacterium]HPT26347.1 glycosyltransferase family 1 protein [Bryobacteraceae bacterium]
MTAALDATYSVGRNLSGVGVYSRELALSLAEAHPEARFLHCYRPHKFLHGLRSNRSANVSPRLLLETLPVRGAGLFHGLNQRMPAWRARSTVCTFHDLFVLTADYSTPEFRARFTAQARQAVDRSDLIACVSNYTAQMVEELLNVDRSRIRVTPHGVRFPRKHSEARREKIILHVGAIQKRKNLVRLVEAFETGCGPDWRMVLAGSAGYGSEQVMARITASPARARIEVTGWVDDATVLRLYTQASVFAFPSLDEGFGIPVLEAMAQATPVIASNRAALPEICGDAALMVDAFDVESISNALNRITGDEALRAELAAKGLDRVRQFTWARTAELTWLIYQELI